MKENVRKWIRIIWVGFGVSFFAWMIWSFEAHGVATAVANIDQTSFTSTETDETIRFAPHTAEATGILFYPGGMVNPQAYVPMAQHLAQAGHHTVIIKLPLRSAMSEGQETAVYQTTLNYIETHPDISNWVLAGHSRGGAIATRFAGQHADHLEGLILIATTHPKESDYSLRASDLPISKIYGTLDGIATPEQIIANNIYLPADTRYIPLEGANHAQFGYYGFQLGDNQATISRTEQQAQLVAAILDAIDS